MVNDWGSEFKVNMVHQHSAAMLHINGRSCCGGSLHVYSITVIHCRKNHSTKILFWKEFGGGDVEMDTFILMVGDDWRYTCFGMQTWSQYELNSYLKGPSQLPN